MNTHRAFVPLKTNNIFDTQTRLDEVKTIMEWVNELVEWDKSRFEVSYSSQGNGLTIWFRDEQDAVFCQLRWL